MCSNTVPAAPSLRGVGKLGCFTAPRSEGAAGTVIVCFSCLFITDFATTMYLSTGKSGFFHFS